jgi:SNF2 family DNA or RNA helicase
VAKELPPKDADRDAASNWKRPQRDLYETVRLAMDKKVREEIDRKGVARSQIVILDALLKLRQVCCDPRLVKAAVGETAAVGQADRPDADGRRPAGRRPQDPAVLAVHQHAGLIEEELDARGIRYALLTGETRDRSAQVAAFQQGAVPIFLISLKAGGVGLNLTAADTVIHYDPWWNPAAENQATDRAWRIGQDKPVFVYKLIAKGTLEEKIQLLQQKKSELAQLDPGGRRIAEDGADAGRSAGDFCAAGHGPQRSRSSPWRRAARFDAGYGRCLPHYRRTRR